MEKKTSPHMTLLEKVWVPIIVALIGACALVIVAILSNRNAATPPPTDAFTYPVRVQARDTGAFILNAEVTIEVRGKAPLDDITDSNGLVRIDIPSSHAGQRGRLIVEATGYKRYTQEIDLKKDALPDVVMLDPAP
jgi:hypothetical protein